MAFWRTADRVRPKKVRWSSQATKKKAQTARTRPHRLMGLPPRAGSHKAAGSGSVPDIDAMPGRFQGPRISHNDTPMATKLSPRPEKISWTRPWVRSTPESSAQAMPPTMAETSEPATASSPGRPPERPKSRKNQRQKTEPRVICPSTPMFQRLAAKVTHRAAPHNSSGTSVESVRSQAWPEPRPPSSMTARVSMGGAPAAATMVRVTPKARARDRPARRRKAARSVIGASPPGSGGRS